MADRTGVPDYDLVDHLALTEPEQYQALFEDTRLQIVDLLTERAGTVTQLAEVIGRPKGTVAHHVGVLAAAGLIHVVRTEKVRAIEAKYYGRTARTFELSVTSEIGFESNVMLTTAATEMAAAHGHFASDNDTESMSTVRHARIPRERAAEFARRLTELVDDFVTSPRQGDVVYGLAAAIYPTLRPHLPPREG